MGGRLPVRTRMLAQNCSALIVPYVNMLHREKTAWRSIAMVVHLDVRSRGIWTLLAVTCMCARATVAALMPIVPNCTGSDAGAGTGAVGVPACELRA